MSLLCNKSCYKMGLSDDSSMGFHILETAELILYSGEKPRDGVGHQFDYDPDMAHPAADYRGQQPVALPPGVSERKLITKIDFHVIPALSVLYLLAFLDRTNVANAAIFGLQKDLGLSATQYSTALTIFFVPYVSFLGEIQTNLRNPSLGD